MVRCPDGDCITAISGLGVESWTDTGPALVNSAGEPIVFTFDRDGLTTELTVDPENGGLEGLQSIGLLPEQRAVIGGLAPAMPALDAGLEEGDLILTDTLELAWDVDLRVRPLELDPVPRRVQELFTKKPLPHYHCMRYPAQWNNVGGGIRFLKQSGVKLRFSRRERCF